MHYTKFVISNYRAITGPLEIKVGKKSLMPIIGLNESGKTTILHAIFAFDHFNDTLNEDGRHLKDTANLYRTSSPDATVEAVIELSKSEFKDVLENCERKFPQLKTQIAASKRKGYPSEISITRNIVTKKYEINNPAWSHISEQLSSEIIRHLPYILFFDDFRDKVEEKIEIINPESPSSWLSIIERLFQQTSETLSVFKLPTLEERQRKTVLAKVQRKLNDTLTKEWQNFRLDERDALEISIDFVQERPAAGSTRNFLKLDIVETDTNGDQHYFFISDRSKGFYWFFNFVMKLEFNPKIVDDGKNTIYLLDEPGSYLHASAQRKLCTKLRQLSQQNRVIYCTHSHYLLDPNVIPMNCVTVADKDGNGNIRLLPLYEFEEPRHTRRSAIQPIIDALEIKPFITDLTGELVVLVEGIYDYFCLEIFRKNRCITILPSVNADSIKYYISMMIAWQVGFRALWDNDHEGREKYNQAREIFGEEISSNNFRLLPAQATSKRIIQNLFDGVDLTMLRQELSLPDNCAFERTIQAFFYTPNRAELLNKISANTKQNFEELFETLNLE